MGSGALGESMVCGDALGVGGPMGFGDRSGCDDPMGMLRRLRRSPAVARRPSAHVAPACVSMLLNVAPRFAKVSLAWSKLPPPPT